MSSKKCSRCGEEKLFGEFVKSDNCKNGIRSYCRVCEKKQRKKIPITNKEKEYLDKNNLKTCMVCSKTKNINEFEIRKDTGKLRNNCKDCSKKCTNEYNRKNKNHVNKQKKSYYLENKEHLDKCKKISTKKWIEKTKKEATERECVECKKVKELSEFYNSSYGKYGKCNQCKDCSSERGSVYSKNNRDKLNENARNWYKEKVLTDKEYKIKIGIRAAFRGSFKKQLVKKTQAMFKYTGIPYNEYVEHLSDDPLWKNYCDGEKIEIEHMVPCSSYDHANNLEVAKCWDKRNLRLLPKIENIKKGNKIDWDLIEKHELWDLLPESILIDGMELNGEVFTR